MKRIIKSYTILFLFFNFIIYTVSAQSHISLLRYDDDFSYLKHDSLKRGMERLKYIPIGYRNSVSLGGELREQVQIFRNANFGDLPPAYKQPVFTQLNHRLMLHANIEIGAKARVFLQFSNTMRFLNHNPLAPEIEQNQLSLHQFFAEVKLKNWKLRAGSQEMFYGSHRLITVREGPNTRKTFDGLVVKKSIRSGKIDLFAVSPVLSVPKIFDDIHFKEFLAGIYGTQFIRERKAGLDYFAIYFHSGLRKYNYQAGCESRMTYGFRIFNNLGKVNFEAEAAYQSGRFNDLKIRAYSALADLSMAVLPARKGVVGFACQIASGDKSPYDGQLNTYNLLFAKPAYGLAVPIGSTNIISLLPYFRINPVPKLNLLTEVFFLSRKSERDGTYSPGMTEIRPRPELLVGSGGRTLGVLYVTESNYQWSGNLSFSLDVSYFKAGHYPRTTGKGKDITYIAFKSAFRF